MNPKTRQKDHKASLRGSEALFRLFMDNSRTIAWIKDEQCRYVYLSKAFEERFDVRLEDWRGKTDAEVWPSEIAEEFRRNDRAVLSDGRPLEFTEETLDPDGSRCHWLTSKFPFEDATGNRYVGGTRLDITRRKQMEEEFGTVLRTTMDGFWVIDSQGRFLDVNEAYCSLSGYSRDELLTMSVHDVEAVENLEDTARHIETVKTAGYDRFETRHKIRDGSRIDMEVSVNYLRDGSDRMFVFLRDITESKRAARVIQARLRILAAAYTMDLSLDDTLRMALDEIETQTNSTIGFYHFVEADQETLSLQNWSSNTLQSMCTAEGKGRHYQISQAGVWVECVRQRRPVIHNDYTSLSEKKGLPPGHAPVIRELVVPIIRKELIVAIIGIGNKPTDYTEADIEIALLLGDFSWEIVERKRAEADVLKLSENMAARNLELEDLNRELEAFIYSVSHDLRAPLRSISAFVNFLCEDYSERLDNQAKEYLTRINLSSAKMSRLIEDLLNLSRLSRQEVKRTEVNMSALASGIVSGLREADHGRNVEVTIEDGLTASADPFLIEIVLSNLIGNAWKFTSKNARTHIEFGSIEKDGKTIYYVRDNGAGFDPQYAGMMFQPFHRLHSSEDFGGTGIGLAIIERIIRRHGGRVWAEGEVGKGTSVYFTVE